MSFLIDFLWLLSGVIWLPLYLIIHVLLGLDPKWLRWWGNRVDNLPDALKEYLHCNHIPFTGTPGYCWNLAFIMKNRGKPYWPIVRKCAWYKNCDPEDKDKF